MKRTHDKRTRHTSRGLAGGRGALIRLALGLALASLASPGCIQIDVPREGVCTMDSECPGGQQCSYGYCVAALENALDLQARILPAPGSGLVEQHIPALDLSAGPGVIARLVAPVTLEGTVRYAGDVLGSNVPGTITAVAEGDLPGLSYTFKAESIDGLGEDGLGYHLALLPGRSYEVTFQPSKAEVPDFHFALDAGEVVEGRRDITLPRLRASGDAAECEDCYVEIAGFVRFDSPEASAAKGIGGARVVALTADFDSDSSVTADLEKGHFAGLLLPPGTTEVRLRVEPPESGPLFPDYITAKPLQVGTSMDVRVPALPAGAEELEARVLVEGTADDGSTFPVAGANVRCNGTLDVPEPQGDEPSWSPWGRSDGSADEPALPTLSQGVLRRRATTDEGGVATFTALPGTYDCHASAPLDLALASWKGTRRFDSDAPETEPIVLEPRLRVDGVVVHDDGDPVEAGVIYAAHRAESVGYTSLVAASPPYQADIEPDGRYELALEPGRFDLRINPALETNAPAALLDDQVADADRTMEIPLPQPGLLHLSVSDPEGEFMANVDVELYLAPDPDLGQLRSRLLAKGSTDSDGTVDFIVPYVPY